MSKIKLRVAQRVLRTRLFRDISAELAADYLNFTLSEYNLREIGSRAFTDADIRILAALFQVKPSFLTGIRDIVASPNVVDFSAHLFKQRRRQVYNKYAPAADRSAEASH